MLPSSIDGNASFVLIEMLTLEVDRNRPHKTKAPPCTHGGAHTSHEKGTV
jgi:hypothetical protein